MSRRVTPEGALLGTILAYLQAEGITAFRLNTGAVMAEHNGKKRFVRFGVPGFADILAIPTVSGMFKGFRCSWTVAWFIEVKSETGRQSAEQKSFERQVVDAGAEYLLARSVQDVEDWMKQHGVKK